MGREIRVPVARGLDVPNFLKDVPRVPKFVLGREQPLITSQGPLKEQMDNEKGNKGPSSSRIRCTKFF